MQELLHQQHPRLLPAALSKSSATQHSTTFLGQEQIKTKRRLMKQGAHRINPTASTLEPTFLGQRTALKT
eukprot:4566869-Amphidinium_carterae.1